jgi:hypothetical protein
MRFRDAGISMFGQPLATVWEVVSVPDGQVRIAHVQLKDAADATRLRHVAVSVLLDTTYYVPWVSEGAGI